MCPRPDRVLLITSISPVREELTSALTPSGIAVEHVRSAQALSHAAESVILCTPETDWRDVVRHTACGASVILLLQDGDASLWAEALTSGAFDAIDLGSERGRLLDTIGNAHARWLRRQMVREALEMNPFARSTTGT